MLARARRVPEGWQPDSESVGIVQEIKRKVGYKTWRLPMVRFHPSSHAPYLSGWNAKVLSEMPGFQASPVAPL